MEYILTCLAVFFYCKKGPKFPVIKTLLLMVCLIHRVSSLGTRLACRNKISINYRKKVIIIVKRLINYNCCRMEELVG